MRTIRIGTALLVLFGLLAAGGGHAAAAGDTETGVATLSDGATPTGSETTCLVFRQEDPDAASPIQVGVNESEIHVSVNRSTEYEVACPRLEPR